MAARGQAVSEKYIDIGKGGSGWFAVLTVADASGHMEPWQIGVGRYRRSDGAIREAASWSATDEVPLHPDLVPLVEKLRKDKKR